MTLLQKLQAHRGGLIRLPTELFWYDRGGWDDTPGRLCLLLDATATPTAVAEASVPAAHHGADVAALLLIDGQPRWIWVAERDVEVIDEAK